MDIKPTFGSTYTAAKLTQREPIKETVRPLQQENKPKRRRQHFQRSHDHALNLGILALGGQEKIDAWELNGLEIEQETILAAFEIFNEATRLDVNNPDSNGISFNGHQIVINHQHVPAWFIAEHQQTLDEMQISSIRKEFLDGKLYYLNKSRMVKPHFLQASLYNQLR